MSRPPNSESVTVMKSIQIGSALVAAALLSGCGPRLAQVIPNGAVLPDQSEAVVQQAQLEGQLERERLAEMQAAAATAALQNCMPMICEAIARREVAIGMTEPQVLAATRTTGAAWDTRSSGGVTSMTTPSGSFAPRDAIGEIAYVALQNGVVTSFTYREPQGFRTVSSQADASREGRSDARADALVELGDEYAAAGRLDLALQRYDQADVIRPGDPETNLRIASTLEKQLRPIEAILRYQLFIHQMELEKIEARGDAAAKIAEAIARAHERIVVLERR